MRWPEGSLPSEERLGVACRSQPAPLGPPGACCCPLGSNEETEAQRGRVGPGLLGGWTGPPGSGLRLSGLH